MDCLVQVSVLSMRVAATLGFLGPAVKLRVIRGSIAEPFCILKRGRTGLLIDVRHAMWGLVASPVLRRWLGEQAREDAAKRFLLIGYLVSTRNSTGILFRMASCSRLEPKMMVEGLEKNDAF